MKKAAYDEDKVKGDPAFNRCWPASKIFRELYSKEMNQFQVNELKENSSQNTNISNSKEIQSEDFKQEFNWYPDYGELELESLKRRQSSEYSLIKSNLEKEIIVLFNEFDEENILPQADKGIQQGSKQRKEYEDGIKTKIKDETHYNMSMAESLVLSDKPSICKQMEHVKIESNKNGSRRWYESCPSLNYDTNVLDLFDDEDADIKKILDGEFTKKGLQKFDL